MGKYKLVIDLDGRGAIAEEREDGVLFITEAERVLDILNSPPPAPPGGIVWRRPGEAGRVDGKLYLVYTPLHKWVHYWHWNELRKCWGEHVCGMGDSYAWAEINPPAWEGEKP